VVSNQDFTDNLTSADGSIDSGCTLGITHGNISVMKTQSVNPSLPADLALFTGPGTIVLPVAAMSSSATTGSGNLTTQFLTEAGANVEVCYNYAPDCNGIGIADADDIPGGSNDLNLDGVPDECLPGPAHSVKRTAHPTAVLIAPVATTVTRAKAASDRSRLLGFRASVTTP
jgi:hypothetical protein